MGTAAIGFSFTPRGPDKGIFAGAGQTNGVTIGYLVTDETGPSIIDAGATLIGTAGSPPGSGTITETICLGGPAVIGCHSPLTHEFGNDHFFSRRRGWRL